MITNRKIFLIMLITAIMSLTACTGGNGSAPPDLTLSVGGETYTATQSSYCWGGLCADGIYPPVIETFVPLAGDGQITLTFDNPEPDNVFMGLDLYSTFPDAESVATTRLDNLPDIIMWTPTVPAGDYILSISAKWDKGQDAAYHIGVTIP